MNRRYLERLRAAYYGGDAHDILRAADIFCGMERAAIARAARAAETARRAPELHAADELAAALPRRVRLVCAVALDCYVCAVSERAADYREWGFPVNLRFVLREPEIEETRELALAGLSPRRAVVARSLRAAERAYYRRA